MIFPKNLLYSTDLEFRMMTLQKILPLGISIQIEIQSYKRYPACGVFIDYNLVELNVVWLREALDNVIKALGGIVYNLQIYELEDLVEFLEREARWTVRNTGKYRRKVQNRRRRYDS